MDEKEKPEPSEVEALISKSGHNLHAWTIEHLRDAEYIVQISPYYVDAHTDKPREVDVIATKRIRVLQENDEYAVQLVLAIDCKYLKQPVVFWGFPNEKDHTALKVIGSNLEELIDKAGEQSFTYFKTPTIARLFQSGDRPADDPVSDPIYKACAQAISGAIFAREHTLGPSLIYPVVVVDGPGKFFFADEPDKETSSLIVHIDYSYYRDRDTTNKPIREAFYVLIIRKENFSTLRSKLEHETNGLRSRERSV